jgi:hypothetical protein
MGTEMELSMSVPGVSNLFHIYARYVETSIPQFQKRHRLVKDVRTLFKAFHIPELFKTYEAVAQLR